MTPMFSFFTLAIKFDCLFFTIFQTFHLFIGFILITKVLASSQLYRLPKFIGFIFDKLAPP